MLLLASAFPISRTRCGAAVPFSILEGDGVLARRGEFEFLSLRSKALARANTSIDREIPSRRMDHDSDRLSNSRLPEKAFRR